MAAKLRRRSGNGGGGDGNGEWAFVSSKRFTRSLEGKTEHAFRVRKRRPYIHTRCIEGILQLSGTYSEEGGME
jgi:hypothetical protein